jgi:hypothetical protein
MRIKKKVQGKWIDLELEIIKKYPRYTRYQVYKLVGNERIPAYTECYSNWQLVELAKNGYVISEEPVEEVDLCM